MAAAAFFLSSCSFQPCYSAPAPCNVPCKGGPPPAIACAKAVAFAHGDPISGSRALNQHCLQELGEKTVGKGKKTEVLISLTTAKGVSFTWNIWIFFNTNPTPQPFMVVFFQQNMLTCFQPRSMCR